MSLTRCVKHIVRCSGFAVTGRSVDQKVLTYLTLFCVIARMYGLLK